MGDLTYTEFKEAVKLRHGGRTDMDSWGTSAIDYYGQWVNSAYRQLCVSNNLFGTKYRVNFRELETSTTATTTDGTAYVADPSDVVAVRTVYDTTNNRELDQIPWKKYLGYTDRTTSASEGDATEWTRASGYIYLHPTPGTTGDTLTIYYKKRPAELTGSTATVIGSEWDDLIVALAAYKGFRFLGDLEAAKATREECIEILAGLMGIYNDEEKSSAQNWQPDPGYIPGRSWR